ncbi:AI-2E family transporter [Paenibacillus sp. GP183]|uniref:AI-2E family transporter n=1 Tax=Paenibacillus sp. GP183 TaxID=1882751 RepID=UPI00089970FB|nr:AI-2E family transporter [Paenibacillus sp. GP183]SEC25419.1 Predicted PurR-regulated permease PerM [Paenibacillus sp. GP183]
MIPQSRFFKVCLGIIMLLLIIFLTSKINFIFKPLFALFNVLIVPFMLAGFFYYLLRPVMNYLLARKVNKVSAILIIYLFLAALFMLFFVVGWPVLQTQITNFIASAPKLIQDFQGQIKVMLQNRLISMVVSNEADLSARLSDYLNRGLNTASNYFVNFVSAITNFFIVIGTAPILLYYMLKESDHIPASIMHIIPKRYQKIGKEMILEMDSALSGFIVGRVIITSLLAVMMYIGFLIIGLPYPLLLALVSFILNIIPYIGPILGAIPVLIVAFIISPTMVLWSLIVVILAQQLESNVLAPYIYGNRMDIHPMTTIVLLLVAGDIAGILGVILAIPAYMIVKILIVHAYKLFFAEKMEEFIE